MYNADELCKKMNEKGYELNKRTLYYYLYDKKMFGNIDKSDNFQDDFLNKLEKLLWYKKNTRLKLDEIKLCLEQTYTEQAMKSLSEYNCFNNIEASCSSCYSFKNNTSEATKTKIDFENPSFETTSSAFNTNFSNNLDNTKTNFNNVNNNFSYNQDNLYQQSYLYSDFDIVGKQKLVINNDIVIYYSDKETKNAIKLANYYIEQNNGYCEIEIKILSPYFLLKLIKILSDFFNLDKKTISFFINNKLAKIDDIYDMKENDILLIKTTEDIKKHIDKKLKTIKE